MKNAPKQDPPLLYRSWSGFEVRELSYSTCADIAKCGTYTEYSRFQGYADKVESAAFKFGIACEEAIYDHYINGLDLEEGFRAKWSNWQEVQLKYSKNDVNWANLDSTGRKLMKQFEKVKDGLPIYNAEFAQKVQKLDWYNGTTLIYIADCISHNPFEGGDLLIDIKTSGRAYLDNHEGSISEGYPALDLQLRTGALVTGIRDVGFLVLKKGKYPEIKFDIGHVTDSLLAKADDWLRVQYRKLMAGELTMNSGVRWPDDKCSFCSFLPLCLGHTELAEKNLRIRSSKENEENLAALEEV